MKLTLPVLFLLLFAAIASSEETKSPTPAYEVVLDEKGVTYGKLDIVTVPMLIRNLGDTAMDVRPIWWGLSLVWDGKEYKRDPKCIGTWNGFTNMIPKGHIRGGISLTEYLVPARVITPGPHTISVKDALTHSNTITVSLGEAK